MVPPETQYMSKLLFIFSFFGQFFVHQTFCQILMSSCGLEIRRLQFPILWFIFHEFLLLIIVWLLSLYRPSFRCRIHKLFFYLGLTDKKQHPAKTESLHRIINVFCTMYNIMSFHFKLSLLILSEAGRLVPSIWIKLSEFATERQSFGIRRLMINPTH